MPLRKRYPNPISLRLVLAMFVFVLITSVFQSACGGGGSNATSTPVSTITAVTSVSCNPTSVQTGQTSQCTATVTGTGNYSSAVNWSVNSMQGGNSSVGTISSSGLYTAPATVPNPNTVTVMAMSVQDNSKADNTTLTVTTTTPTITSVSVSCNPTSVQTGGTSQCTARVTGTGNYSSAVNWSVNTIQGGNSTVGTISSSGLYTAPSSVPSPNPVTVTATSVANTAVSGSAQLTVVAAVSTVSITSLSTTSPLPLTPMTINTSGVNPSLPMSLQFSDSSGFSVTESPIRVNASGSMMVIGVPLCINPSTGTTGPDTMSLVLTQGSQSSAPVIVNVQDLPSVGSYGATPGQISHAALVFEAMVIGQRINQLQAFQALPGNTVDTTQAQSVLAQLLISIIQARSDVDSVTSNPSLVIPTGVTSSNGTPIQFDQTALDMMDRINGLLLSEVFSAPPPTNPQMSNRRGLRRPARMHLRSALPQQSTVTSLFAEIDLVDNIYGYEENMLVTYSSNNGFGAYNVSDYATALSQSIGTTLSIAGTASGDQELAALGSTFSLLPSLATALGTDAVWIQDWVTGNTVGMGVDEAEMAKGQTALWAALDGEVASLVSNSTLKDINGLEASTTVSSTISDLIVTVMGLQEGSAGDQFAPINLQSLPLSNTTPPSSSDQGIATVNGTITVPNQGIATPQSGLEFCCVNDLGIIGIVDANGNYESFMPLGATNTNYSGFTLYATDPLTGATLGSEAGIDLSGLVTTTPTNIPTLTTGTTTPLANSFDFTPYISGTGEGDIFVQNMSGGSDLGTSCGLDCYAYPAGTVLSLTEEADVGSTFDGWTGACTGTGACTITMNQNQTLTADFENSTIVGVPLAGTWSGGETGSYFVGVTCAYAGTMTWTLTVNGTVLGGSFTLNDNLTAGDLSDCSSTLTGTDTFTGSLNGSSIALTGTHGESFSATVNGTAITGSGTFPSVANYTDSYTLAKQP